MTPQATHRKTHSPTTGAPSDALSFTPKWGPQWAKASRHFTDWWHHRGFCAWIVSPRDKPLADYARPVAPEDPQQYWMNVPYRTAKNLHRIANTYCGADSFLFFETTMGPGSMANYLGSEPGFSHDTVWYRPCIDDPDTYPDILFDGGNTWFQQSMAIVDAGLAVADGRFLVAMPDLIENLDIVSAMRDPQTLMMDVIDRPAWVEKCIRQINQAYFQVFDAFYEKIHTPGGGNCFVAFNIWGPGKTAKVQCDTAAMISPAMFKQFYVPAVTEQCAWLDYSVYHLDGPECICHLDHLLAIEPLRAIQFTTGARNPAGGDPAWWAMYKKILAAGKSVHVTCKVEQVLPLLDAIGPKGVFVNVGAADEATARGLEEKVAGYY